MEDSLITIIGLVFAAILMFIFPLMTMANRTDDVSQLTVEIATMEFIDDVRTNGKIATNDYTRFLDSINSTQNTYNVEIEVKIKDENPSRVITNNDHKTIGENVYYSVYTSQIEKVILDDEETFLLKEGDIISVSVKNTNQTLSQQLQNIFYKVVGKDVYIISASHSGIVAVTGNI